MQSILEAMTKSEIKLCLSNMSTNLDQAFENTIQRIGNQPRNPRHVAIQSLMWVSHARRALQVDDLCHALATNLGDTELDQDKLLPARSIVESCFGLIVLDDESSTFRLVHYTLQGYLHSQRPQFEGDETYITQVLITYLCFDGPSHLIARHRTMNPVFDQSLPMCSSFFEYAATNWGHHAKLSRPSEINELALALLSHTTKLIRATQAQNQLLPRDIRSVQISDFWESRNRPIKTGLHIVAEFGLVELLGLLLDRKLDINARDGYNNTALHDAAIYGQADALNLLLERGAKVNVSNSDHNTPLYLAVSFSHEQLIPTLLRHGAHLNKRCRDDWSAFHKVADNGHVSIAQTLLDNGACVTARSARGLIPLHRAVGRGHIQMTRLLLDRGSPVDAETWDGWTPLHGASSSGQNDVVKTLLARNADVDRKSHDGRTALHRACRGGYDDVALTLLMANADLWVKDSAGDLPLHRAAKGGHEGIIRLLLQQDSVSPLAQLLTDNLCGHNPEKVASYWGHWKVAALLKHDMLLHKGTSVEKRGDLELAIEEAHLPRVMELISIGTNVNSTGGDSLTPLNQALLLDNEPIAQVLLENGADVAAATSDGWQPLHCAASIGMTKMVSLCLNRKADIAARTLGGQTALHKSCKCGNVETVRLLLESGADIEAQDDCGWRPLLTACAAGFQDVVELLLAAGADLKARDRCLRTVHACAARAGKHALVEYLRQARHAMY